MSVTQAISKRFAREMRGTKRSVLCPCCERPITIYHRHFHREMVSFLAKLCWKYRTEQRFYSAREINSKGAKASTDASYLAMWGLIQKNGKSYAPTCFGMDFIEGGPRVPKYAVVLLGNRIDWSKELVSASDVWGSPFKMSDLMG